MNAMQMTGTALASALRDFTREPTLSDVAEAAENQRTSMHFLWVAQTYFGMSDDTPTWEAKIEIIRRIDREESKRRYGHWSFDANRLIAMKQMLARIEAYEVERKEMVA